MPCTRVLLLLYALKVGNAPLLAIVPAQFYPQFHWPLPRVRIPPEEQPALAPDTNTLLLVDVMMYMTDEDSPNGESPYYLYKKACHTITGSLYSAKQNARRIAPHPPNSLSPRPFISQSWRIEPPWAPGGCSIFSPRFRRICRSRLRWEAGSLR